MLIPWTRREAMIDTHTAQYERCSQHAQYDSQWGGYYESCTLTQPLRGWLTGRALVPVPVLVH